MEPVSIEELMERSKQRRGERVRRRSKYQEAYDLAYAQDAGMAVEWKVVDTPQLAATLATSFANHNKRYNPRPRLFTHWHQDADGVHIYVGRKKE